jgi:hypothetical protein
VDDEPVFTVPLFIIAWAAAITGFIELLGVIWPEDGDATVCITGFI